MKVLLFLLGCLLLATPVLSNPPFPPGRPTTIRFPYSSYSSADDWYRFPYVYHPIAERLFKSGDTPDNYDFIRLG
ncbi:hypothetical protein QR680_010434 [Steinernema hermaphroditum]|uniref:Uncharacterized protein n=1 Tax=Steinernema hermaphroditum TaxID=289476 RepID=A0AA39MBS4_9BILA|nr:hypothetical protein QR680_010434 [Steinernema hermaphroditum]